jgi:hypothetical protein
MHPIIKSQAKQQPTNKGKASKNTVNAEASHNHPQEQKTSKTQSTQQTKPQPPTRIKPARRSQCCEEKINSGLHGEA